MTTKKKARVGRPKGTGKYTPELGDKICEWIADGKSARSACREYGITLATLYSWRRQFPEFSKSLEAAREDQADTFADDLCDLADSEEDVQRARLKVEARKWIASRMKPKSWGDRLQVDQKTTIETASDSELKAELARKLEAHGLSLSELLGK